MAHTTSLDTVADRHGFVVAYLSSGNRSSWLGAGWQPPDDLHYVRGVIDRLVARGGIDPTRVYAIGFSAGGSMAYRVGCQLGSRVAAIGAVSAAMGMPTCRPRRPVSVLTIIGDADQFIPIDGTPRIASPARTSARWARLDRCRRRGRPRRSGVVVARAWYACEGRSEVALYVIVGGVHAWPGGAGIEPTSPDARLDASTALWRFLRRARRP
jgi:polyhydroxybutyrate depolymerase